MLKLTKVLYIYIIPLMAKFAISLNEYVSDTMRIPAHYKGGWAAQKKVMPTNKWDDDNVQT